MKRAYVHEGMRVLVVGNGAREHAIAWKLSQSQHRPVIYTAPGNPGMENVSTRLSIPVDDVARLVAFSVDENIDLVVVGPEAPLSLGLADELEERGIPVFGPSRSGAQLETSKGFAKDVMKKVGVRTADYRIFSDAALAHAYVDDAGAPIVIKADGLAAGKGVVVAMDLDTAHQAIDEALVHGQFGTSGQTIVVESYLEGPEATLMFFVDANTAKPMLPARDHKRIGDGNTGPNTGGMGAIAPVLEDMPTIAEDTLRDVVEPVLEALRNEGIVYRGVLYVGLMLTKGGPAVIEFNARFGDPETQSVLPLLESDLLEVLWACAVDDLSNLELRWHPSYAIGVVSASAGYPENPQVGQPIEIKTSSQDLVFHAGTKWQDGQLATSGGRVLTAVGIGPTPEAARQIAYNLTEQVYFEGRQFRSDIGK